MKAVDESYEDYREVIGDDAKKAFEAGWNSALSYIQGALMAQRHAYGDEEGYMIQMVKFAEQAKS